MMHLLLNILSILLYKIIKFKTNKKYKKTMKSVSLVSFFFFFFFFCLKISHFDMQIYILEMYVLLLLNFYLDIATLRL